MFLKTIRNSTAKFINKIVTEYSTKCIYDLEKINRNHRNKIFNSITGSVIDKYFNIEVCFISI